MGFVQPCFIRKNNPELRKKLEELGYKLNNGKWMGKYLATFRIKETKEWRYVASPEWDLQNNPDINVSIDCGTNKELFFAIAALRDDTDSNQWFTNGKEWMFCPEQTVHSEWGTVYKSLICGNADIKDCNILNYHKASIKELIEHFKEE